MKKEKVIKEKTKKVVKREKEIHTKEPMVISYTIKATISTGPYSNIQPELTIYTDTVEEAEKIAMEHIEKMYDKYLDYTLKPKTNIQMPPPNPPKVETPKQPAETPEILPEEPEKVDVSIGSDAFKKAKSAIDSCKSLEALDAIKIQISRSVKLTPEEKKELQPILAVKKHTM